MIEIVDTSPDIHVDPAEYRRLLGYPRDHEISERAQELAESAREWYAQHGRPWLYARQVNRIDVDADRICIDGAGFTSQRLAAIRAGLFCVGVPNAVTSSLSLAEADLVVPSLAELPFAELIARFEESRSAAAPPPPLAATGEDAS